MSSPGVSPRDAAIEGLAGPLGEAAMPRGSRSGCREVPVAGSQAVSAAGLIEETGSAPVEVSVCQAPMPGVRHMAADARASSPWIPCRRWRTARFPPWRP